jgi:glycosyltransferase involved in cell wall biosynthesis
MSATATFEGPAPLVRAVRIAPRILHVDGGRHWAGGQNQVRLLMRELATMGVEQLCLCPAGSPLHTRLIAERLPVRGVTWRRGSDPRAFVAVASELGRWQLVHCHDAHALQVALIPAKLRGRPVIAHRRVCFRTRPLKWNRAARVIAISEAVRAVLVESGVRPRIIRKIHSGIDVAEVRALDAPAQSLRSLLGIGPSEVLAGNVGTLLEFKNQTLIPAAASHAADTHWVIVGEGPRREVIEQAIAAAGVGERVRMTGALADARRYLRDLDVFVFTSKGEALGTSILDAMALDIPVVAVDDAGPGEILAPVHASVGASLVPPDDAAAFAHAVERFRGDEGLRSRVLAAQRRRLDDFRIERTAEQTVGVYREVLGRA